jgi:hypothetical protein
MKNNMGGLDKIIRLILALIAGLLVYLEVVSETVSYIILTIAAIFVITSLVGFCPLYGVLGISTCRKNYK